MFQSEFKLRFECFLNEIIMDEIINPSQTCANEHIRITTTPNPAQSFLDLS